MRQLKNLMKAKKPMWRCGECKCVTLQAWKCADELCGCVDNSNAVTPTPTPTTYTVTIASNDATMGTVDESSLIVEYGTAISENDNVLTIDTVNVTATAEAGYSFSNWADGDGNALPATITGDITIIANFTV